MKGQGMDDPGPSYLNKATLTILIVINRTELQRLNVQLWTWYCVNMMLNACGYKTTERGRGGVEELVS